MFYLLEGNRIIDSEDKRLIFFNIENLELQFKYDYDSECLNYASCKIKSQSENVFDLIEKGDLITQKRIWCDEEIYVIANVFSKEDELIHCFHSTLFEHDVCTIYKPDSNGDYIKVWEQKNE